MTVMPRGSGLAPKMPSKRLRIIPFLFLLLFAFTFLTSTFLSTQNVGAITKSASKDTDPDWQVKSLLYYRAIASCFKNSPMADGDGFMSGGRIDADHATSGLWFGKGAFSTTEQTSPIGVYFKSTQSVGSDGKINCGEESKTLIKSALTFWDIDATTMLCNIGMLRVDMGKDQSRSDCISGSTAFERPSGSGSLGWSEGAEAFKNYISKNIYDLNGAEPGLLDYEWYHYYKTVLVNSCIPNITSRPSGTPKGSDNKLGYNDVKWVAIGESDRSKMVVTGSYNGALNASDRVTTRPGDGPNYSAIDLSCSEIVSRMNAYADAYADWANTNKTSAEILEKNSIDNVAGGTTNDEETTSCKVEGIGWILCPVANAMAGITDALFEGVKAFMLVAPLSLSTQDNPLYNAWSVMRSIANVAFVIVFLVIIFSQLTSAGVSNYGVKKLLPRLIIGAILVNISYFICAIAVDLSNIFGVGIQNIFTSVAAQAASTGVEGENWGSIVLAVLSGSATAVGVGVAITAFTSTTIWAALAALLPLLVGALFALVIAFLVLLARQALIIMLIVLAPLAFVAYLLPNTESIYKKWQKLFTTLLVLFPMLSVVFGASMLASVILRATSTEALNSGAGNGFVAFCLYIGSFAVQAIPFFITPLLINLSQGVLSRFAGLVNNKNKGPFDRLRKGSERIAKDAQNRGYANKLGEKRRDGFFSTGARRRAKVERRSAGLENLAKNNTNDFIIDTLSKPQIDPATGEARIDAATGQPVASKLAIQMAGGDSKEAQIIAAKAVAAGEAEELKEAMQPLIRALSAMDPNNKSAHLQSEIDAGGARQAAALNYSAQVGDTRFLREQLKAGESSGDQELVRRTREAIQANTGSVIGKAPDLVKGEDAAFGSVKGSDLAQFKPDTAAAYTAYIKKLAEDPSKPEKYQTAVNGFNSAVQDIQNSPELQAQFSGEVGTRLVNTVNSIPPEVRQALSGVIAIQSDGKIRSNSTAAPESTQSTTQPSATVPTSSASQPSRVRLDGNAEHYQTVIDAVGGIQNLSDHEVKIVHQAAEERSIAEDAATGRAAMTEVGLNALDEINRRGKL